MIVTMVTETCCPTCGYGNRGVLVGNVTVRIRSLQIRPSIGARPPRCVECRGPLATENDRTWLDSESAAAVEVARERLRVAGRRRRECAA